MKPSPTFVRCLSVLCAASSLLLCLGLATVAHAEDQTLMQAQKVLASNDAVAKKAAINSLASGGKDEDRIPALIAAMGDRQVGKIAIEAMERRTGLKPAISDNGDPGYPGYPTTRNASGWSAWWAAKQKETADKKKLKELEEAQKAAAEAAKKAAEVTAEADAAAVQDAEVAEGEAKEDTGLVEIVVPDSEKYGNLDRVIFKSGNSLLCYIVSKQVDLDGRLTSIDIVHRNGGGQESISADMVSSYEEDVR